MEFWDVVKKRESVRGYDAKKVPKAKIEKVLEAARLAPSWRNCQCWDFIIIQDQKKKEELLAPRGWNDFAKSAPVLIVACGTPAKSGTNDGKDYYLVDVAIAMEQLVLAAAAEGLGTCWIGSGWEEANAKAVLGIPKEVRIIAMTPLGYPKKNFSHKLRKALAHMGSARRKLEEITHWEYW